MEPDYSKEIRCEILFPLSIINKMTEVFFSLSQNPLIVITLQYFAVHLYSIIKYFPFHNNMHKLALQIKLCLICVLLLSRSIGFSAMAK